MAVSGWPDFANANLADWEPVGALLDAIRERADVLRCVHLPSRNAQNSVPANLVPDARPLDAPAVAVLEGIRTAVCRLAAFYVDPDNGDWRNAGCATDVAAFGSDAPVRVGAAHSLAALPRVAECEADPDALAEYRAFLANAAWWIDAFRYVDASERAAFAALLEADASMETRNWAEVAAAFASPTVTRDQGGYPLRAIRANGAPERHLRLAAEVWQTMRVVKNDSYPGSGGHAAHADSWTAGTREEWYAGGGDVYDELSVVNPAPLAADVCLLPIQSDVASRSLVRRLTGAISFVAYEPGYGHYRLASYEETDRREFWFGAGLLPDTETALSVTATGEEGTDTAYTRTETVWHNSPDGSESEPETVSETSGAGSMSNMCRYPEAYHNEDLIAFDAFGSGATLGVPLATGAVAPARGKVAVAAWAPNGRVPVADGWADRPTDAPALSAPGPQNRELRFALNANLGLAVLFDFGPHFQHGGIS